MVLRFDSGLEVCDRPNLEGRPIREQILVKEAGSDLVVPGEVLDNARRERAPVLGLRRENDACSRELGKFAIGVLYLGKMPR